MLMWPGAWASAGAVGVRGETIEPATDPAVVEADAKSENLDLPRNLFGNVGDLIFDSFNLHRKACFQSTLSFTKMSCLLIQVVDRFGKGFRDLVFGSLHFPTPFKFH